MTTVRIGTRGSELALWQAREVAIRLAAAGYASTIIEVRTTGDRHQDVPLASIGGKGLFIKELEDALDRGAIDIAVHSLKDVPSIIPGRFVLASFLERADARDVWISRDSTPIAELRRGARIGTSSPRRRAQLLSHHRHLVIEPIRGNLETRIDKVRDGAFDGIVLARAGLDRLGRASDITSSFTLDELVPAAGQGVIAMETRADATIAYDAAAAINHPQTELVARCERGVLQQFGEQIGCDSAIAVHATLTGDLIAIRAVAADCDGDRVVRVARCGTDPGAVAMAVYSELVGKGAMDLILAFSG